MQGQYSVNTPLLLLITCPANSLKEGVSICRGHRHFNNKWLVFVKFVCAHVCVCPAFVQRDKAQRVPDKTLDTSTETAVQEKKRGSWKRLKKYLCMLSQKVIMSPIRWTVWTRDVKLVLHNGSHPAHFDFLWDGSMKVHFLLVYRSLTARLIPEVSYIKTGSATSTERNCPWCLDICFDGLWEAEKP